MPALPAKIYSKKKIQKGSLVSVLSEILNKQKDGGLSNVQTNILMILSIWIRYRDIIHHLIMIRNRRLNSTC